MTKKSALLGILVLFGTVGPLLAQTEQKEDKVGTELFGAVQKSFATAWNDPVHQQFWTNRTQFTDAQFLGGTYRNVAGVWSTIAKPNYNIYAPTWLWLLTGWQAIPSGAHWGHTFPLLDSATTFWVYGVPIVVRGEISFTIGAGLAVPFNNDSVKVITEYYQFIFNHSPQTDL